MFTFLKKNKKHTHKTCNTKQWNLKHVLISAMQWASYFQALSRTVHSWCWNFTAPSKTLHFPAVTFESNQTLLSIWEQKATIPLGHLTSECLKPCLRSPNISNKRGRQKKSSLKTQKYTPKLPLNTMNDDRMNAKRRGATNLKQRVPRSVFCFPLPLNLR